MKAFAHIPGVIYPDSQQVEPEKPSPVSRSGEVAIFDGDEWFYVEFIGPKHTRRLWALFPVKGWAERWISEMEHPENFQVKQLRYP